MLLLLLACTTSGSSPDATSDTGFPTGQDPEPTLGSTTLSTEMTWTLDFDDDAEANGFEDCSYSRSYEGQQFVDRPWLCPACTVTYDGTAVMTEGYDDCYAQISSSGAERTENWGFTWNDDGGAGLVHRSGLENWALGELGEVQPVALDESFEMSWSSENELSDGGTMVLAATGTGTESASDVLLVDYDTPRQDPYACGWPTNNPGTLATDYSLSYGAVVPNARLEDACGELVDLWDFHGRYLVVDIAQPDCGPCKSMSAAAPAGLQAIADAGYAANALTVLGGGLATPYLEPDDSTFSGWLGAYGDGEPVLKDRGWGYAVFQPYWDDDFGYPTFAIVAPDMTVLSVEKGYGDATWAEILDTIAAHAAR